MEQDLLNPAMTSDIVINFVNLFNEQNSKHNHNGSATDLFEHNLTLTKNDEPVELTTNTQPLITSYAVIGKKKSAKSPRDTYVRRQKTFVQKVFLELIYRFSETTLQALLHLNFYQEICKSLAHNRNINNSQTPHLSNTPLSPYFVSNSQRNINQTALKSRFLKMIRKKNVALRPTDHFQLACALSDLWEQAIRIVEQQTHTSSSIYKTAEKLVTSAKQLPEKLSPLEDKKNLVHISSFKIKPKTKPRASAKKIPQNQSIQSFIDMALTFGQEYLGII